MSKRKNKILVPYDFSSDAENALKVAFQMVKEQDQGITLLHVIDAPHFPYIKSEFSDRYNSEIQEIAMNSLKLLTVNGIENQVNLELIVEVGHPARSILNFVRKEKISLVIMGSQGIHSINKALIGSSTTEKVVRYASCPVITVKNEISLDKIRNIIFATDLTTTPLIITQQLTTLCTRLGASLLLLKINTHHEWQTTGKIKDKMRKFAEIHDLKEYTSVIYDDKSPEEGIVNFTRDDDACMLAMPVHNMVRVPELIRGYHTADKVSNDTDKLLWTYAYDNFRNLDK